MKRPFIMIRLKEPDYETDKTRKKFINVMKQYGKSIDSVALFVGNVHNFLPFNEVSPRLSAIRDALIDIKTQLKTLTGINVLATLGHLEEVPDCWNLGKIPQMINYDGTVCLHTPCPSSSQFLDDTTKKYKALAELNPDFIWIDDDFRMHNHYPATLGCFCHQCMEGFAKLTDVLYSRDELVYLLSQNDENAEKLRAAWLTWCNRILLNIVQTIEKAVHEKNPRIVISLMIAHGIAYNYPEFLRVLRKKTGYVFVRPGGGFYNDTIPAGLITKAVEYSQQISVVGTNQKDVILAEVEHFPYNAPMKSRKIFATEVTSSIASGCHGATINISGMIPDIFHEYCEFLKVSKAKSHFWRILSDEVKNLYMCGALILPMSNHIALKKYMNVWQPEIMKSPMNFIYAGIPVTGDRSNSYFSLLTHTMLDGMSLDELKTILSKPAILDATAVRYLHNKRLSYLTGVCIDDKTSGHCVEQYCNHKINEGFVGKFRDSRPGFFKQPSFVLRCVSKTAVGLCRLKSDYKNGRILGISAVVFKNIMGAKIASFGYDAWEYIFSEDKLLQIHRLVRWLTDDKFPFMIIHPARICPFLRYSKSKKKMVVVMVNTSFDEANEIKFYTNHKFSKLAVLEEDGKWASCQVIKNSKTGIFTLQRKIEPWDCLVLKIIQ
ncbi:MAG TPA: hypothetical protein PKW86_05135 [bacterium]|nr:hypothetical protein [bacterium]